MAGSFTVISYNLHGFNQGEPLLREFCANHLPHVVYVQEHWLSNINMSNILSLSDNYYCLCTSAMEDAIQSGILRGRPFGGVAILFRNDLSHAVKIALSERYIIARISNVFFINIYAPAANTKYDQLSELQKIISEISGELYGNMSSADVIIFGGDCNTDLRVNSNLSNVFKRFFSDFYLTLAPIKSTGIDYTFANSSNHFSFIDFFAVSCKVLDTSDAV